MASNRERVDHQRREAKHKRQHHLAKNQHNAGPETQQVQHDETQPTQNGAGHPAEIVADGVKIFAELFNRGCGRKVGLSRR